MATYTLSNRFVSAAFVTDATYGFKLIALYRLGQNHTWGNQDGRLWSATLWDALNPTASSTVLNPDFASLTALTTTREVFEATWTAIPTLGTDTLNVVFTATLDPEEDFLRIRLRFWWTPGASRAAIDAIGPIPLKMQPFNSPADVAVMPMLGGIISRDPITHLRYAASPGTTFFLLQRNEWFFPSGHGWSMPVWGYYETAAHQGWMLWLEDFQGAPISVRFESNATEMEWQALEPQPDHVVIGNGGRELPVNATYCLRPFQLRTNCGWGEIAAYYRDRYELKRPTGYCVQRAFREDFSEIEKMPAVFIDVSASGATHTLGDGKPGDVVGLIRNLRQGAGIPLNVPIWGTCTADSYNMNRPGEVPNGDLSSKLALLPADRVFLTTWFPGDLGPELWDIHQWLTSAHVANERRWHTTYDVPGALRESRRGYLAGDTADTLLEESTGYWRERTYTVVSYDSGTLTVTVSGGTPNADGFIGTQSAVLVRGTTVRLAQAAVTALGATTVTLSGLPTDALGTTRTPTAGDSLVVFRVMGEQTTFFCPHAVLRSPIYLAAELENIIAGPERNTHICGRYVDGWSHPWSRQPDEGIASRRLQLCYADHQGWSLKGNGYVSHPLGGGAWNGPAFRDLAASLRDAGKASQRSNSRGVFFAMNCEFVDEYLQDVFDVTWSPCATGDIWRNTIGVDPSIHKYLCVPLFAFVHAGRHTQRALNQEFSTALADPSVNFSALREFLAYCLSDWPYGMTAPTYSLFQSDTIPFHDLWDESIYAPHGSVNADVRRVRDLWKQVMQADLNQTVLYMKQGQAMIPAEIDYDLTDTTTGLAQTTFANDYHTYDVIYDRATYPRVTHGCWKARDGSVMVVLINWTFADARWAGILDVDGFGFDPKGSPGLSSMSPERMDGLGRSSTDVSFDSSTAKLVLENVPALSVALVTFKKPQGQQMAVHVYRPRWEKGTG